MAVPVHETTRSWLRSWRTWSRPSIWRGPVKPFHDQSSGAIPKVSIVIPCYNQGQYVRDALESARSQTYQNMETIIVNDGSTDAETAILLRTLAPDFNTTLIETENHGLPMARNHAIERASGEFILPLDADDCLGRTYVEQAVSLMRATPNLGIVYCNAEFFGAQSGKWVLPEFSFPEMLFRNHIFCSALYRKADWAAVGGYNPNCIHGLEDYDFWLSILELGRSVHKIPDTLFFYRQHPDSRAKSRSRDDIIKARVQLFHNHTRLYTENIGIILQRLSDLENGLFRESRG